MFSYFNRPPQSTQHYYPALTNIGMEINSATIQNITTLVSFKLTVVSLDVSVVIALVVAAVVLLLSLGLAAPSSHGLGVGTPLPHALGSAGAWR